MVSDCAPGSWALVAAMQPLLVNSASLLISTGTDATLISNVVVTCGVMCPVESQFVKLYKRMKNNLMVYVACDGVRIPLDAVEQWESSGPGRSKTDSSDVVMHTYHEGVDRELGGRRSALYPLGPPRI
ncbi:hypothetical protein ANO14919_112390 [Xylariales sp. No.14919]|nr:hypothetical protein ANO14919_112390 [Xylariales sp. No.14919]